MSSTTNLLPGVLIPLLDSIFNQFHDVCFPFYYVSWIIAELIEIQKFSGFADESVARL